MQTQDAVRDDVRQEIEDRALRHMVEAVSSTAYESEPFAHIIVRGLFPDDIYRELLELLPSDSQYKAFNPGKPRRSSNPRKAAAKVAKGKLWTGERTRFKLTNESIDRLEGRQRSFWLGIRNALGHPEFKLAVYNRLRDGLAQRFGPDVDVAQLPGYPLPELFRERSGYKIKPHPDTDVKVVTMQIALPPDRERENLGTEFYNRSSNPLHRLREPRGFELAKQTPFLPNTGYAFVVLPESWHGRTRLAGNAGVRNSLLHLWYTKPKRANPDIVQQYYSSE